ncbi:MAG: DEAD/DEAH box helicase [Planctomycetota bacterium]|nr:MAG: DEAD/DEAH box helicase [Planctomycetota bacterium]
MSPCTLSFEGGSVLLRGLPEEVSAPLPDALLDRRVGAVRLPAHHYHLAVRHLVRQGVPFEDRARAYQDCSLPRERLPDPRDYQREGLDAWHTARRRGIVVLPTGAGKTVLALWAIAETARSALVVVPTLDLLNQWYDVLCRSFGEELVGTVGGGSFEVRPLTVITYDSAYLHLERLGDRFGLLICDEAHHLTGETYASGPRMCLAPFRLGLTATPPDGEGMQALIRTLGPVIYRKEIVDLAGDTLSPYETVRIKVSLPPAERAAYEAARQTYRAFVRERGLRLGGRFGWARFLAATSASAEGRAAFAAWRAQRRIALATPAKLEVLADLLSRHANERMLVFTHANECAYEVSRRFLVPVITHQTRPPERRAILQGLVDGSTPVVATSRVLNEGVDLPSVGVGVVLSGTATVREHVQRLGRLLRRREGKRAILYEVVTADTSEEEASKRRREHSAYR